MSKYPCGHEKLLFITSNGCVECLINKYNRLLEFVKSISNHFNLNESELDFMKFYTSKEEEASNLLQQIGETK